MQRVGGEGSKMAREVSMAGTCAWRWAWTRVTELTSNRLLQGEWRLERQRLLLNGKSNTVQFHVYVFFFMQT